MVPWRCYNGSSIFNTTQRLNMSQVKLTFRRTCSADRLCCRHQSRYIIFWCYKALQRNVDWYNAFTRTYMPTGGVEKRWHWWYNLPLTIQYVQSCSTCQRIDARHKTIRASRFVLSTLKPMERISIETIVPFLTIWVSNISLLSSICLHDTWNSSLNRKLRQLSRLMPFGAIRVDSPHL